MGIQIEIELKAWVEDPPGTAERLFQIAQYIEEFRREDAYWFLAEGSAPPAGDFPLSGIRVRKEWTRDAAGREAGAVRVTYKYKELREGMEVNDERELLLAPPEQGDPEESLEVLEGLLRLLRLEPRAAKVKQGRAWRWGDIRAELTLVEGLGWFLELEILSSRDDQETQETARLRLLDMLDKTGVSRRCIETRYYTEMLAGTGAGKRGLV